MKQNSQFLGNSVQFQLNYMFSSMKMEEYMESDLFAFFEQNWLPKI